MEPDSPKTRLNKALRVPSWRVNNDYKSVAALIIHWQDCEDRGFKEESHALGNLFAVDFHYNVEYYAIPSIKSQMSLDKKINSFLTVNDQANNLVIIHYGGHGDADDEDDDEKLAVWAAHSSDGPKVDWSTIQPKAGYCTAEVLLLLDCCYGGQAARATRNRRFPHNVELVAACAMGVKTIRPGPRSFTMILIDELKTLLRMSKKAHIQDIVNRMVSRYAGCRETPVRFSGLKPRSTICLEPLIAGSLSIQSKQEKALMTLKVSLRDTLDDSTVGVMTDWLSVLAPRQVSKLTVEDVIVSTGYVHDYIFHTDGGSSSTSFQQLSKPGKDEIWAAWDKLKAQIAVIGAQLKRASSSSNQFCQTVEESPHEEAEHLNSLQNVESKLLSLQRLIERHVMALPKLYEDKDVLLTAIEEMSSRDLGFLPVLELRLKARFPSELDPSMKANHVVKSISKRPDLFATLVEEKLDGLGLVLVEYKTYGEKDATSDNVAESEQRMKHLTSLLQNTNSTQFRTLRCTKWFHEKVNNRFGLIFQIPVAQGIFTSLRDVIETFDRNRRPTLGQRFSIARMIGNALLRWHTADWVHQGIASHNIIFFSQNGSIDYRNPYLCGFEYARPSGGPSTSRRVQDFELNVYRDPDRQGIPNKYHTKRHDIYSFGVLLLEIGIWALAKNCFSNVNVASLSPMEMKHHLIFNSKQRLGHYVGGAYQKAADRCLNIDLDVVCDDAVESQLAMNFEDLVLRAIPSGDMID